MKALRCQDDEFGHHLRKKSEMIKVIDQRGRGRSSSSGMTIPKSVIHHIDIDMTMTHILNLIFHATGKKCQKKSVLDHVCFLSRWLKENGFLSKT